MSKKECSHKEWNPCGNDFYSCRECGILRTRQQVNLYAEKNRQIADLEIKLAQSKMNESFEKEKKENALKFVEELKQQLAEKEKEIEGLELRLKIRAISLQNINNERIQANQDKISFAVGQLEKVKELLLEKCGETLSKSYCGIDEDIEEVFDNQIKQLKDLICW